jgi:hypothetical protein
VNADERARERKRSKAAAITRIPTAAVAVGYCTDCGARCRGRVVGNIEQNVACCSVVICDPCDRALRQRLREYDRKFPSSATPARRRRKAA